MKIIRKDDHNSQQGTTFTGNVTLERVLDQQREQGMGVSIVHFEDGARTNWHTHPLGQTLHVLSGVGLAQTWGGPIREIRPGDTIWFAPGEKHWHGASPESGMVHLAMQEALDGKAVDWLEHVTDAQYGGK